MSGIPLKSNAAYTVCQKLCEYGSPVTLDQGIAVHGYTGIPKRYAAQALYQAMVNSGYLIEYEGTFTPSKKIKEYFAGCIKIEKPKLQVVAAKYHKPFTEMKPQEPREGVRKIYFKTVGGQ